jgi:hypothetical protein
MRRPLGAALVNGTQPPAVTARSGTDATTGHRRRLGHLLLALAAGGETLTRKAILVK